MTFPDSHARLVRSIQQSLAVEGIVVSEEAIEAAYQALSIARVFGP